MGGRETRAREVIQADREAAAKALGYRSYDDATDYRTTGAQDRAVAEMIQAFALHRQTFADEARVAERERCAGICDALAEQHRSAASNCESDGHRNGPTWRNYQSSSLMCATAIRKPQS